MPFADSLHLIKMRFTIFNPTTAQMLTTILASLCPAAEVNEGSEILSNLL